MKNTIVVIILILVFVGILVFANTFIKNYPIYFEITENKSGENMNDSSWEYKGGMIGNEQDIQPKEEDVELDEMEENNKVEEKKEVEILKLTNENFEEKVLKNEGTVLIDFYADWCGPCKLMAPIVEQIATENPEIKVGKINIDEEESLAIQYRVMSIPTFMVVKNGEVVNKVVGAVPKSELENLIK